MSAILLGEDLVHYETLGRGKPVLFLHGWVGSWRYLIPSMQALSMNNRAYALDLFGFGGSAKNGRYSIEDQASLVEGFLEKMGIHRTAIVGHGLGGMAGMLLALRKPDLIERTLVVSLPLDADMVSQRLASINPLELTRMMPKECPFIEPVIADAIKADKQAVWQSLASLNGHFSDGQRSASEAPCLLIHGSADPLVQPPQPDQLRGMPVISRLVMFEGAGHYPMLDDSRKYIRLMIDFFNMPKDGELEKLELKEEWKRRVR